nr:GNAT family N-acetyltransferase [Allomuricauda sp.]
MEKLPGHYGKSTIFRLYLERALFGLHDNKVKNLLTLQDFDPNLLSKEEFKQSFFLAKDIPDYLQIPLAIPSHLKVKNIRQYQGYLVNLNNHSDVSSFLKDQLSKRNIKNLYSKKRKLERLEGVSYEIYFGRIEKSRYDLLFATFYQILKSRFDQKKIFNKHLFLWKELYRFTYPQILDKRASLFVISKEGQPLCLCLNYHLEDVIFSHIQTYDPEYSSFNLGDISMLNQLEWCFGNGVKIFDVSMGFNPYKQKWCNHIYQFHHQLLYSPTSPKHQIRKMITVTKLKLMQKLRDLGIAGKLIKLDRWYYYLYKKRIESYDWNQNNET